MIEFRLPELGEGIESGQVIEVFVTPGDRVSLEQPLLEVETDKAAIEIPSPADGTVIDVCVSAGDTVGINQILVKINGDREGEKPPSKKDVAAPDGAEEKEPAAPRKNPLRRENLQKKKSLPALGSPPRSEVPSGPLKVPAAPSVRRLARELGVELRSVPGTGPRGRILEKDVKAHAKAIIKSVSSAQASPAEPELPDFSKWGETRNREFLDGEKTYGRAAFPGVGGPARNAV